MRFGKHDNFMGGRVNLYVHQGEHKIYASQQGQGVENLIFCVHDIWMAPCALTQIFLQQSHWKRGLDRSPDHTESHRHPLLLLSQILRGLASAGLWIWLIQNAETVNIIVMSLFWFSLFSASSWILEFYYMSYGASGDGHIYCSWKSWNSW